MVATRYYNANLHDKLSGMILSGFNCEYTYMHGSAENARICGGQCSKSIPQLDFIGDQDHYFGANSDEVSFDVANATNGYGGPITGNCRAQYDAQNFSTSTTIVFPGVGHGVMYSHGNALFNIMNDFFAAPTSSATTWASLDRTGCTLTGGVYSCDGQVTSGEAPCVSYAENPNATVVGTSKTCTAPTTSGTTGTSTGSGSSSTTGTSTGNGTASSSTSNGTNSTAPSPSPPVSGANNPSLAASGGLALVAVLGAAVGC